MKTLLFQTLKLICLLTLISFGNSCVNVSSQSSRIPEVENNSQAHNQAPPECLAVFHEFFAYVQKVEPSIVTDVQAQNRWLTQRMRKSFVDFINRSAKP